MHSFLKKHLFEYSTCCLENFPEELRDVELLHSRPTDSSQVLVFLLMFQKYVFYLHFSQILAGSNSDISERTIEELTSLCRRSVQNQNPVQAVRDVVKKC